MKLLRHSKSVKPVPETCAASSHFVKPDYKHRQNHCCDKSRCTLFTMFCFGTSQHASNNVFRADREDRWSRLFTFIYIYMLFMFNNVRTFSITFQPFFHSLTGHCRTCVFLAFYLSNKFHSRNTSNIESVLLLCLQILRVTIGNGEIRNTERPQICVYCLIMAIIVINIFKKTRT